MLKPPSRTYQTSFKEIDTETSNGAAISGPKYPHSCAHLHLRLLISSLKPPIRKYTRKTLNHPTLRNLPLQVALCLKPVIAYTPQRLSMLGPGVRYHQSNTLERPARINSRLLSYPSRVKHRQAPLEAARGFSYSESKI